MSTPVQHSHATYGFGLERIGIFAAMRPITTLILLFILSAASVFGLAQKAPQGSLSELFRSSSPQFATYDKLRQRFPTSEFDVLVVLQGAPLATPQGLELNRTLHLDLEFTDGVSGVLSAFSIRGRPDADGFPPPVIPDPLPEGDAFKAVYDEILSHEMIDGRFLTRASESQPPVSVMVISIAVDELTRDAFEPAIDAIREAVNRAVEGSGITAQLSGAPVMQTEIRSAIQRDRMIFNTAGFFIGFVIVWFFLRSGSFVLITSVCPPLAVLWALGMLGLFDIRLNTFVNVIPPLVMVIAFSDAMHMVFSIRRSLMRGESARDAAITAVRNVGPACALTSLTTTVALFAMMVTDSALIRSFGIGAGMATLLAFVAVITIVPALTVLFCKPAPVPAEGAEDDARDAMASGGRDASHGVVETVEQWCRALALWVERHPRAIFITAVPIFVACLAMHLALQPKYALSDEVPTTNQSIKTAQLLEERLSGSHPLHVMITWPEEKSFTDPDVLAALEEVHRIQSAQPSIANVWSVHTLRQWLEDSGQYSPEKLRSYIDDLPEHLSMRFFNEPQRALLVTGRVGTLNAKEAVPIMAAIDGQLEPLRRANPEFQFEVSGFVALSSTASASMIEQLKFGLLTAIVVVVALIGVAFRSLPVALLSFMPNLLPIAVAGSALYLTGYGLAYASVIALTVAFGLAVDDTIHFLSRYTHERRTAHTVEQAITTTLERVGPVLVLTTLVLLSGLSVTALSDLPALKQFGSLNMLTLFVALVTDMLLLPALILVVSSAKAMWMGRPQAA